MVEATAVVPLTSADIARIADALSALRRSYLFTGRDPRPVEKLLVHLLQHMPGGCAVPRLCEDDRPHRGGD